MAEFLSSSQRASIVANLLDLHDTFGREIIVYKEAQKVIIATNPNYNYLYNTGGATNESVENIPVRKVFKARIRYDTDRSLEHFGEVNSQIKVDRTDASSLVRIKLKSKTMTILKRQKE